VIKNSTHGSAFYEPFGQARLNQQQSIIRSSKMFSIASVKWHAFDAMLKQVRRIVHSSLLNQAELFPSPAVGRKLPVALGLNTARPIKTEK